MSGDGALLGPVTAASVIAISPLVQYTEVDGRGFLVDLGMRVVHETGPGAALIWSKIDGVHDVASIHRSLEGRLQLNEIVELVRRFRALGVAHDATGAAAPQAGSDLEPPLRPAHLELRASVEAADRARSPAIHVTLVDPTDADGGGASDTVVVTVNDRVVRSEGRPVERLIIPMDVPTEGDRVPAVDVLSHLLTAAVIGDPPAAGTADGLADLAELVPGFSSPRPS